MMNHIRSGEQVTDKRGIEEADEKFNIINIRMPLRTNGFKQ